MTVHSRYFATIAETVLVGELLKAHLTLDPSGNLWLYEATWSDEAVADHARKGVSQISASHVKRIRESLGYEVAPPARSSKASLDREAIDRLTATVIALEKRVSALEAKAVKP